MEMDIKIQCVAEALHEADGAVAALAITGLALI